DPASAIGLAAQAGNIIILVLKYGREVKDASGDIQALSTELFALEGILRHVETQIDSVSSSAHSSPSHTPAFAQLLQSTHQTLDSLAKLLSHTPSSSSNLAITTRSLKWPLRKGQVAEQIQKLERLKTLYILSLTGDTFSTHRALVAEITRLGQAVETANRGRVEEKQSKATLPERDICTWVAPVDTASTHREALAVQQPGTGAWFAHGPLEWLVQVPPESSAILWLQGRSGSGKTTLLARSVCQLRDILAKRGQDADRVAFFYCSFGNLASQNSANIVGSLLVQLRCCYPGIIDRIEPLYRASKKREQSSVTIDDLVDVLSSSLGSGLAYFVIDAVNETSQPAAVANTLSSIARRIPGVRLLMSSTQDAPDGLSSDLSFLQVKMQEDTINDDIAVFVDHRLNNHEQFRCLSVSAKTQLRQAILGHAKGMFRYASLVLDNLASQRTGRAMKEALAEMPSSLNESYARILGSQSHSAQDRQLLRRALLWLCFATRPLTLADLADAVVIEDGDTDLDEDARLFDPHILVELGRGLIAHDRHTEIVSLSHSSVKTFLTSSWLQSYTGNRANEFFLDQKASHAAILSTCLTLLQFTALADVSPYWPSQLETLRTQYPLLYYADTAWTNHIGDPDPVVWRDIISPFLRRRSTETVCRADENYESWIRRISFSPRRNFETTSALYFAASFGHTALVRSILAFEGTVHLNTPGGRYGSSPLHVACWRGQREVVRLLLEAGADPRVPDPGLPGVSPLKLAGEMGWKDIVALMESWVGRRR
ncbi:hypothetical protein QBC47DRAFT_270404, partial [Echria macrotheca]